MSTAVTANESTHLDKASGGRKAKDQLARIIMWLAFLVALAPLAWILYEVLSNGLDNLLTSTWWTNSQRGISVRREGGGAYHAIMGTLLQGLVTAAISVPIGIFTAAAASWPAPSASWSTSSPGCRPSSRPCSSMPCG